MKIRLQLVILLFVFTHFNQLYGQYIETGVFIKYAREISDYQNEIIVNPATGNSFTFSDNDTLRFKRELISFNFSLARALPKSFRVAILIGFESQSHDDELVQFLEVPQYLFTCSQYSLRSEFTIQKYFLNGWLYAGAGISNHLLLRDVTEQVDPGVLTEEEWSDYSFLTSIVQPDLYSKKTLLNFEFGGYIGEIKMLKLSLGVKYGMASLNIIHKGEFYYEFGMGLVLGDRSMTKNKIYEPYK